MVVEEYYNDSRLSQSKLKLLLGNNPNLFNTVAEPKLYFEEKKYFLIGDGVDCQLTRPITEYAEKFHISNVENKPSDTMKSIINQIYDEARSVEKTLSLTDRVVAEKQIRQTERSYIDLNTMLSLPPRTGVLFGNGIARISTVYPIEVEKTADSKKITSFDDSELNKKSVVDTPLIFNELE